MSSIEITSLLQLSLAFYGIYWKIKEGYALVEAPDLVHVLKLTSENSARYWPVIWLEVLAGVSFESLQDDWPWFSLHLFLYMGQLIPFVVIIIMVSTMDKKIWVLFRVVAMLGGLSTFCGLSIGMPIVSVWILHGHKDRRQHRDTSWYRRSILGSLLLLSTFTHIGSFAAAFIATWVPSAIGTRPNGPMHMMNSLVNVPMPGQMELPTASVRQARLRQINEMTGTSSGFFMAAGILWRVLESRGKHISYELLIWMFLVSLIAGPAAGSAAVLLLAETIVSEDGFQGQHRLHGAKAA
ncbi:hypothetical protein HIM_09526 [Hirsutella minnesotensis 3608]|uniref:Uncharacterized protein n=1 Tax=Hirsutella minnesotensis 3608 TaxID=1043627 RepID=A0A0F7ZXQ0_9HYPO|nr:hypothetical protein HIM_09526 [Hirsutella minnesotensis 3608]